MPTREERTGADGEKVTYDARVLKKFIDAFERHSPSGKLGVLGSKNGRSEANSTNAEIGAKHEFGTDGMPTRSWLRRPLIDNMQTYLLNSGAFDKRVLEDVVKSGSIIPWLKKVMVVAERIVADAFATGGFGKWRPSNMALKKNHQTLVETGQLMRAVTSEVSENG